MNEKKIIKKRSCGCPVGTDYRVVSKFDHVTTTEADAFDAVTICARCEEEIEL